jgi:hypothetical protein
MSETIKSPESAGAVGSTRLLAAVDARRSHRTCWLLISALASHCAASENEIIDRLTGYLFDEEEAGQVKANEKADR